jgi:diguanylate cyclase (GGDEF)-like protein
MRPERSASGHNGACGLPAGGRFGSAREQTMAGLVDLSEVGLGFLGEDLRFVAANPALGRRLGATAVMGRSPSELHGAAGAQLEALLTEVLRTGKPVTVGGRAARISYHRVVDDDGHPVAISAVAVDPSDLGAAQLRLEAETDGLTGLANHRVFQERLLLEVDRAQRHGRSLSLALVDIDGFKQLNDTFGHQTGDDVLARIAGHLADAVRLTDTVARIGGDEFAILLPETDADAAQVVAERAHDQIRRDATSLAAGVTVSIGVCDMAHASDRSQLMRFADGALYWAKAHGRDAVWRYSPEIVEDLSLDQRADRLVRNKALAGIRALARAIDAKDHSTMLHSERVASLAGRLADAAGWSAERVASLREAALIHDVGKIGVSPAVLGKVGALSAEEYEHIKAHAALGAQIASEVLSDEQTTWLRGHHEHFDGRGYPDGLAGDAIAEGALLLALADSWDVMTSTRSYSEAMTPSQAIAECQRCAGTQFSPAVVAILTRPGFERVLRMVANEQATRDRNDVRVAGAQGSIFELQCECGTENCASIIRVPADVYRSVRALDRRYVVAPGHEIADIEAVLSPTARYTVVEKH